MTDNGAQRFWIAKRDEAVGVVQQKELANEKERKKDMQRKRRREKVIENEDKKYKDAVTRADHAEDESERMRHLKEAERAHRKAKSTKMIMSRGGLVSDMGEAMQDQISVEEPVPSSLKLVLTKESDTETRTPAKSQTSAKVKKEKIVKKAGTEKVSRSRPGPSDPGAEPIPIAPKEPAKDSQAAAVSSKEPAAKSKDTKSTTKQPKPPAASSHKEAKAAKKIVPHTSKGYNQMYEQIVRDIARKDVPRVFRIKETSTTTKLSNMRKTAQLAAKEARRWQARTNKGNKELVARCKRVHKEMLSFWKKNEKEEKSTRLLAEKQELEKSKKAEVEREANRQKRKLNFLISQTELYSHFIGRKVKTDEVERSTDDVSGMADRDLQIHTPKTLLVPDLPADLSSKVTNFEDLDFDAEDDASLQAAAMANAQNAIQEAQDRARRFNREAESSGTEADADEMNFQNPAGLGDMDISQPKMLTAQLKEYQLKGLNWLANLYEQGINGILADEMGLGKTIQSIAVMAYLAEQHGIWGPFVVVAPSSTLHNWQQEIARFVPNLKVLPYWGTAKDRKVLRKFWDRKHITYTQESDFHVLITSYQLIVGDAQYFQKMRWQYMILDEAQAIKSSQSSRWKSLLQLHCRNRLLLTGTPIQNNMQELWALLHFIMPSLFDSHDEFSEWFSKDIESHAQSHTKLNDEQLKRLHMILKPFMLRRVKKHVQKELGDKIEEDVYCDLSYRQRAFYANLRNKIKSIDLLQTAARGDDSDTATLMNLVMQFRKVCNHPDLFARADIASPFSMSYFAETASFMREGPSPIFAYSSRSMIEYPLPRLLGFGGGRLDLAGPENMRAGFETQYVRGLMSVWSTENIRNGRKQGRLFNWLPFAAYSPAELHDTSSQGFFTRATKADEPDRNIPFSPVLKDTDEISQSSAQSMHNILQVIKANRSRAAASIPCCGFMSNLLNVSDRMLKEGGLTTLEQAARPAALAPPIQVDCLSKGVSIEKQSIYFDPVIRKALSPASEWEEHELLEQRLDRPDWPARDLLPQPISRKIGYTYIRVPSMGRFVTDCGKLARLDFLLQQLKAGGHRVLLYFQMVRMIDLMEEFLSYRNYKFVRLDGSTKLEDRRDTVAEFQTRPDIFIFLLSTRAGGLGINLTAADTVIFYDSDWNPTIDSQAMDRAHRLGQTRQVTVYRLITRNTIEERIRKVALQKEEVQKVVITGGSSGGVDFNTRTTKESRNKDIALWLADDDEAAEIEKREREREEREARGDAPPAKKLSKKAVAKAAAQARRNMSLEDMYHEGKTICTVAQRRSC